MKIASWNVNGIKSMQYKGLMECIQKIKADVFCFQETKTCCQINTPGYYQYWNNARRRGYAGTMVLTKKIPLSVTYGFNIEHLDQEGRMICLEFSTAYIINVYVPNSQSGKDRLDYRTEWDGAFLEFLKTLGKPAIICGDFNVARDYIDIYPENLRNNKTPYGFLAEEREGMERIISAGYVDSFRKLYPKRKGCYTWWSNRLNKRLENRGWRIDYILVEKSMASHILDMKHETQIMGSDHCPITLDIRIKESAADSLPSDSLAEQWKSIDWQNAEEKLLDFQRKITVAASQRDWHRVERLQKKLTYSIEAKVLAIRHVSSTSNTPGIDGVVWSTNSEKMRSALSLTSAGYHAQPYRCFVLHETNKDRRINLPTMHDRAMQTLYSYSLDPVAEATADRKSFAFRKGRSPLDAHSYIMRMFSGSNAPEWVVHVDIHSYFDVISHKWLLQNIHMCYKVLKEFLNAGIMLGGRLFPTTEGISQGAGLSTIISNMTLDGLQKYIFDRLFGYKTEENPFCYRSEYNGSVYPPDFDYHNGDMVRFADDIIISARSKEEAEKILVIVAEFLAVRGLRPNREKTYIAKVQDGFDFLSRYYLKEDGFFISYPSEKSMKRFEMRLYHSIMGFNGSQKSLITKVNRMLLGWANYHRVSDIQDSFRHIDALVQSLFIRKIRSLHPKRQWGHLKRQYWYREPDGNYIFALADNPAVRVVRLSLLPAVKHHAIQTDYNPYFDQSSYEMLQERRKIQKRSSPKLRGIWTKQQGRCFYCGNVMESNQNITIVEKEPGEKRNIQNLVYVHEDCANMDLTELYEEILDDTAITESNMIPDIEEILDGVTEMSDDVNIPYQSIREFFRRNDKSPVTLTFHQIEDIMGDTLDTSAYTDENFWFDLGFCPDEYAGGTECISQCWESQGYSILRLHMDEQRIVFQKTAHNVSGLFIPPKLTNCKLPDEAIYEANEFFRYLIEKYSL